MSQIDRQQAIDALMERFKRVPTTAIIAKDVIENLPSAQPEPCEDAVKKQISSSCGHENDSISRQAAITAIQNAYCDTEGGEDKCAVWKNVGLTEALHIMQDLPSAQPEIIYCKDCKHYALHSLFGRSFGLCERLCNESHTILTESNDFCSHAERRKQ